MDNFFKVILEVIGVTFPVFAVIAIGFFIKKKGLLKEEHVPVLNNLTYNFGLSALIFLGIIKNKFGEIFDTDIIKVIFPAYFIYIAILFLSFYFTRIRKGLKSVILISSFRSNMAFIGLPVLLYAYGSLAAAKASIIIALLLPFNIILTALFLQFINKPDDGFKVKRLLKEILLDPVILAVAAGLLVSYFNINIPGPISGIFDILSNIAVPLALLSIGASFKFSYIRSNLKYLSIISALKLLIFPLVTLFFSLFIFKTAQLDRDIICILFAAPVAVSTFIQSRKYTADSDFVSAILIISTISSALTLTAWLFILRLI